MKLRVYEGPAEPEEEPVDLALHQIGPCIDVDVVDSAGKTLNTITTYRADGTARMRTAVSSTFGFRLDAKGRIKVVD